MTSLKVENWLLMISKKPLTDHCSGTHFGDPLVLPFANTIVGLQGCSSLIIKSLSQCDSHDYLYSDGDYNKHNNISFGN